MSTAAAPARQPYLEGIFAPVTDERTDLDLPIIGELPPDLAGHFVRNSPNPRFEPLGTYHWFDGDGMIHGVEVSRGKASYRNRYIRTKGFGIEKSAGRAIWSGIMMPVDLKNPHGPAKNTANTDLVFHDGKLLATWWLGDDPYHVALPGLETVGPETLGGTRRCGMAAHPKLDPRTGELMFFDYSPVRPPFMTYAVASADGRVTHTTPIDLPGPRLLHDVAITDRHTILCDFPMTWDAAAMRQGKRRVVFHKEIPARFGVLPRHAAGSEVRWFEAESCYMYHTINAYEEGDEIVLTGCRIDNPVPGDRNKWRDDVASLEILQLVPYLHRWHFNLKTGEVREEQLDDRHKASSKPCRMYFQRLTH
ncbi:MAG: carotenoid oxygenase family protein [Myxococcales bacterium]|nr:carotenoid oxygenase family protein [Myxococcales bacterium]